jgi:hypothetical protein
MKCIELRESILETGSREMGVVGKKLAKLKKF